MRTLSRSNTRSILIAGALILCAAPAFAQQGGGGGRGGGSGEAGGGSDIYELILKDPAKTSIVCLGATCVEVKPNPRPRPSRVSRRGTPTEACRGATPERDWTTGEIRTFNSCAARRT